MRTYPEKEEVNMLNWTKSGITTKWDTLMSQNLHPCFMSANLPPLNAPPPCLWKVSYETLNALQFPQPLGTSNLYFGGKSISNPPSILEGGIWYCRYRVQKIIVHVLRFTIHIYQAYLINHKSICTFIFHKLRIVQIHNTLIYDQYCTKIWILKKLEFWRQRVECLRYGVNFLENVVWGWSWLE